MWIVVGMWVFSILLVIIAQVNINRKMCDKNRRLKLYYQMSVKWLNNIYDGKNIEGYFHSNGIKEIVIYGKGEYGKILYKALSDTDINILAFADGNKREDSYFDIPVWNLNDLKQIKGDVAIVVTPVFDYDSIAAKLKEIQLNCVIMSLEDVIMER